MKKSEAVVQMRKFGSVTKKLEEIQKELDTYETCEEMHSYGEDHVARDPHEEAYIHLLATIYEMAIANCEAWFQSDVEWEKHYEAMRRAHRIG